MEDKSRQQNEINTEYQGKNELRTIENSLPRYNSFIIREFIRHSGINNVEPQEVIQFRALDFGAGLGTLAELWKGFTGNKVECLEIDPKQLDWIRSLSFIGWSTVHEIPGKYDFIYSSNVLEHIEDDVQCLQDLSDKLKKGARLGIYVPALMILFSDLDRSVGHYRRYSKVELSSKVNGAGFKVISCEYVDSLGFLATLLIKILGWKDVGNIGSVASLKFYDRFIFPLSRLIDRITNGKLVGKNIFLIAERE